MDMDENGMKARAEKEQSIAAGILSFLLLLCAVGDAVCGIVWVSYGGPDGHGLWSGFALFLAAALGILQWRTRSRTVLILFLLMSMVSLIICLAQAAFTGLAYRATWRTLSVDPQVQCGVVDSLCRCNKTKKIVEVPFRLSSCDRLQSPDWNRVCYDFHIGFWSSPLVRWNDDRHLGSRKVHLELR